jgi:simple sugar transport system permease protein
MKRLLRDLPLLLLCLAVGLVALALVIRITGASPVAVAQALWQGAFGNAYNTAETLAQTVPLLLTGLGVALAFRARLFNIGAEGQLLVGAIAATWVGVTHFESAMKPLQLPLVLLAGAVAGAVWAGVAALLKTGRGVQEVLSTLLLNFVAVQLLAWMVRGPLQERAKGYPQSDPLEIPARMALLLPKTHLHGGVLLALALAVLVWFYLRWTVGGFALRAVGAGAEAAEAAGIPLNRTIATAFLLSGALSGLAGAIQVAGVTYLLSDGISPGYGYTAIAVALLANLSPLSVVPSALFFGALTAGSVAVQQKIPGVSAVVVQVLQAVTLFALLGYAWARERRVGGEGAPT